MFHWFHPNLLIDHITELSPARLRELRICSLFLDVDCTLKRYRLEEPLPEIGEWLKTMKAEKIGLCLISNGRGTRIRRFAESVQIPFMASAMKPLPFACNRAVRQMQFDKQSTAIVGDQVFSDLLAGKLAGLFTVLVTPIHPEEEPLFTRLKRPLERLVLPRRKQ
jgi:HAD superfamily phosphatase (TIGR01668 family)